jgi:dolichol-phosphate mannosyltransferase
MDKNVNPDARQRPLLSVVSPVFNEEDNLPLLYERVSAVCAGLPCDWEMVLVDDGSRDRSVEIMRELHAHDPRVKAVVLSRNFGHEVASTAGLDAARGDVIVLIDSDLQDPPELIADMIAKWNEGFDMVCAQRASRDGETVFKKVTAYAFYRLMGKLVGWSLPRDTGDFRLMDRSVVDAFRHCREQNRFVRALIAWTGFRQTVVPFERSARNAGETKYNAFKLIALAITSITGFSLVPLRLATWAGVSMVLLSIVFIGTITIQKLLGVTGPGYGFLMASMWFIGGVQCMLIGVLGEYIGRTYVESRRRPLYFVREALGDVSSMDNTACVYSVRSGREA